MPKPRKKPDDPVVRELDAIKRLLMLQLLSFGVSAQDIALGLGVVKSYVSETIPIRKLNLTKKKQT